MNEQTSDLLMFIKLKIESKTAELKGISTVCYEFSFWLPTFSQFCASLLFPASILCVPLKQSTWMQRTRAVCTTLTGYTRTCVFQLLTASMELISQMRFLSWSIIISSCWFFCLSFCNKKQNVTFSSSLTYSYFQNDVAGFLFLTKTCVAWQNSALSHLMPHYMSMSVCRAVKAVM